MDASVIVATYNRCYSLGILLESLKLQVRNHSFEVVVVDDGSTDSTGEMCAGSFPYPLRYCRLPHGGYVTARNAGVQAAQAEILIFLDDDMTVAPGCIDAMVRAHRCHPRTIAMGRLAVWEREEATPFFRIYAGASAHPEHGDVTVDFTQCATGCLSLETDAFHRIGGLEAIVSEGPAWWVDVDFGYRAWKLGYCFLRVGDAVCTHRDYAIRDLASACTRARESARLARFLFARHPQIRDHLPMFRDKQQVRLREDPPALILRKLLRCAASRRPVLKLLERLAGFLERRAPADFLLVPVYRWTIGGYLYQGYRNG